MMAHDVRRRPRVHAARPEPAVPKRRRPGSRAYPIQSKIPAPQATDYARGMCGIAGKIARDAAVDGSLIDKMCRVIEHRGPDSRGVFLDRNVGLGVQRLAIIDLQTGDQPIFNEDRSIVVVLNGEIYNYRELRSSLVEAGHRFATHSDTEALVHLYEDKGDDCVQMLRGMFAF